MRVPFDMPSADHLHHQVHGELAVETRQKRITCQIDLELVKRRVRRVPLLVRDGRVGGGEEIREARELRLVEHSDRALRREELECQAHVVSLCNRACRHRSDVVPAPRPHREQALGDETRERVVHRAPGYAELVCERVQAQLRSRGLLSREDARSKLVVDPLVEVRPGECQRHVLDLTCQRPGGNRRIPFAA